MGKRRNTTELVPVLNTKWTQTHFGKFTLRVNITSNESGSESEISSLMSFIFLPPANGVSKVMLLVACVSQSVRVSRPPPNTALTPCTWPRSCPPQNIFKVVTARKPSLGQGNIFTPVCHSVHREGACSRGGCLLLGGGVPAPGGPAQGVPGEDPPRTATAAGGTHPTGMHSCLLCNLYCLQADGLYSTEMPSCT